MDNVISVTAVEWVSEPYSDYDIRQSIRSMKREAWARFKDISTDKPLGHPIISISTVRKLDAVEYDELEECSHFDREPDECDYCQYDASLRKYIRLKTGECKWGIEVEVLVEAFESNDD